MKILVKILAAGKKLHDLSENVAAGNGFERSGHGVDSLSYYTESIVDSTKRVSISHGYREGGLGNQREQEWGPCLRIDGNLVETELLGWIDHRRLGKSLEEKFKLLFAALKSEKLNAAREKRDKRIAQQAVKAAGTRVASQLVESLG